MTTVEQRIQEDTALRKKLNDLLQDTKDRQHEIASDASKLKQVLYKANEHLHDVKKPTEAALDAEVMNIVMHGGVQLLKQMASGSMKYNVDDFVRRLKTRFLDDCDAQERAADEPELFPWATLRNARFAGWFRPAPQTFHMFGPMSAVPPPKRQVAREKRKRREIEGEGVRPDLLTEENIIDDPLKPGKETDKNMEVMWNVLKKQPEMTAPMVELCLNHNSFSQTVENIFTLSFLVRDGRVSLSNSSQGILVSRLSSQEGITQKQQLARDEKERVQFVMALSMRDWHDWCDLVDKASTLMPDRPGQPIA